MTATGDTAKSTATGAVPALSVVIPLRDEIDYVDQLVESLVAQTYPAEAVELLFIDGASRDGTRERLSALRQRYLERKGLGATGERHFRVLDNPEHTVPWALNRGIAAAKHDFVVRLDAHSRYESDYLEKIVEAFEQTGADIVGGPYRVAARNRFQDAVGQAICSRFAIGGSRVHQIDYRGETDSVAFGAWRREIFERIGGFDVELTRNQDDEFHYRARRHGLRIHQSPDIRLHYYPRDTPAGLFRQYFQYGLFKPAVLRKVASGARPRHLAPAGFVLYLATLPATLAWPPWSLPLALYLALLGISAASVGRDAGCRLRLVAIYPIIHAAYGLGFLAGLPRALRRAAAQRSTDRSRGAAGDPP
ncbi:MAG: glycosyltransferase family 2 protein [Acidobacteria bacterium]|nr:MAG: glycosyltransferase family 2 protein [Acidobacteriota bacterium]REK07325.1 MAG: glycosyltransferase family 2 protein [Acidobacteriota bacterium]